MAVKPDNFPSQLQAARQQRGMTQAQLAEAAGLQQSAIAQFEGSQRKPSLDNLRRLAIALDVSADYLLGLDMKVVDMGGPAAAAVSRIVRDLPEPDIELLQALAEAMHKRAKTIRRSRSRKK